MLQSFLPSNFTSNEYIMNSHSFMFTLEATPPSVPASSPEERMYLAPFTIGIWPSVLTDVGPCEVSDDCPLFGYGIGTGPGAAGVLDTSGQPSLIPPRPWCPPPRAWTTSLHGLAEPPRIPLRVGAALLQLRASSRDPLEAFRRVRAAGLHAGPHRKTPRPGTAPACCRRVD